MRLNPIPRNTVVRTPTEAEAKELLVILHENGYVWYHKYAPIPNPNLSQVQYIFIYQSLHGRKNVITYCDRRPFEKFFTLAEFKERYCEEEKPQPKFDKGQKVRITNKKHPHYGHKGKVGEVFSYDPKYDRYRINGIPSEWEPGDLEPYTQPEAKPTENMETKELNLCELLKGHEGEEFYSPIVGDSTLTAVKDYIYVAVKDHSSYCFFLDGRREKSGAVVFFPSLALYEQYPLDPYTAWIKWKEEQKKPFICIHWGEVDCNGDEEEDYTGNTYFRTPADRDKCIEEIQTIIEKYSKK